MAVKTRRNDVLLHPLCPAVTDKGFNDPAAGFQKLFTVVLHYIKAFAVRLDNCVVAVVIVEKIERENGAILCPYYGTGPRY